MRVRSLLCATAILVAGVVTLAPVATNAATAVHVATTSRAIWPLAPARTGYPSAVAAARSFAVSRLGMDPTLTVSSRVGASSGVVTVRLSARGIATNIHVVRPSAAAGWWVLSSTTPWIDVTSPRALASVASPLRLVGTGEAFEGVLNVRLYVDGRRAALVTTTAMAGGSQLAPFSTTLRFPAPGARWGTLIVSQESAKDGSTVCATSRRLLFG